MNSDTNALALIVDDEVQVRRMLSELLVDVGYRSIEAGDADEAMRLLAESPPTIAILDINLPGMSGAELAWKMRERNSEVTLIALSGHLKEWDGDDLQDLGFDRIFPKPMDCDAFLEYCGSVAVNGRPERPERAE